MRLPLAITIEQDYPAYAPYPGLSSLVVFADDTNLTVPHTPQEPHAPDEGPTVTPQANDLLDVTIPYLFCNNLMVQPTGSMVLPQPTPWGNKGPPCTSWKPPPTWE